MLELKILKNIIDYMDEQGLSYKFVYINIDENLVEEINSEYSTNVTLTELKKAADRCIAREWLIRKDLGSKYNSLAATAKGVGVVRSKIKSDELEASKGFLIKISDYIEIHKGVFIFFAFIISCVGLGIKILGDS